MLTKKDLSILREYKAKGLKIVFTNGCFDILHAGHIAYLKEAKTLGDILVIGLNSDDSINKIKGPERPIQDELTRMVILQSLKMVDHVFLFGEETPLVLIESIIPDVLVKGGDWSIDNIIGADLVIDYGGQVKSLNFKEGHSTTSIIEKIKNL